MSRSFGIVENKINESAFFFKKIREEESSYHFDEAQFYLSAFMSACRSITFALQASLSDLKGFNEWYELKRNDLKKNKLTRFFSYLQKRISKKWFLPNWRWLFIY